ncbi:N-acetyltransferase family protein [Microbispora sp. NPDC049125]|uniref:GNAT family N-acetyltransferase n=1 Tax=Microbispora sp. NPDC049125 TaxID=3154929 RepID=UPI003465DECB
MEIEPLDPAVPGDDVAALHAIVTAHDRRGPSMSLRHFTARLERGASGEHVETWVIRRGGEVAGGYSVRSPEADNTHLTLLPWLAVRPGLERRGLGGALLDHVIARARAQGRRVLIGEAAADLPGSHFAKARGFTSASTETRHVLDLRATDWSGLEFLRTRAGRHATGYSLERWTGPAPDDLLGDMAQLSMGMNDEPSDGLDVEDERWDGERFRAHDEANARAGLIPYTMVARHSGTGEPAGYTRIFVSAHEHGGWARQSVTAVLRPHRGRRLGLVLKLANLTWLHACEPSIERVLTWTATSNAPMRAINAAMGYEVLDTWHQWQLDI